MNAELEGSEHKVPSAVIVLAAGAGTRMKSATPKVMHSIGGRSMVEHAVAAARDLTPERLAVVVRHQRLNVPTPAHKGTRQPAISRAGGG